MDPWIQLFSLLGSEKREEWYTHHFKNVSNPQQWVNFDVNCKKKLLSPYNFVFEKLRSFPRDTLKAYHKYHSLSHENTIRNYNVTWFYVIKTRLRHLSELKWYWLQRWSRHRHFEPKFANRLDNFRKKYSISWPLYCFIRSLQIQ